MRCDLVLEEGGDGRGHGEVGLAGAGGADAEDDRVLLDGLEVEFLAERLGHDALAVGGDDERLAKSWRSAAPSPRANGLGRRTKSGVRMAMPWVRASLRNWKKSLRHGPPPRRGLDLEPVLAGDEPDAQALLGVGEVVLAAGVELAEVPRAGEVEGLGRSRFQAPGVAARVARDAAARRSHSGGRATGAGCGSAR